MDYVREMMVGQGWLAGLGGLGAGWQAKKQGLADCSVASGQGMRGKHPRLQGAGQGTWQVGLSWGGKPSYDEVVCLSD